MLLVENCPALALISLRRLVKGRWLATLIVVGVLFGGATVATAAGTWVQYLGPNPVVVLNPGQQGQTGYTGLGWTENKITFQTQSGTQMGSNYQNTAGDLLKTWIWSSSGFLDDTRHETNYARAICRARGSNNSPVIVDLCTAHHN
jgi:hypothetical protein